MTPTLILIPTDLERRLLLPLLGEAVDGRVRVELCGFGPVVAAARSAGLVAAIRPRRVILAGIAGALVPDCEVGSARRFARVACYGIGVGTADEFVPAEAAGWLQWPGDRVSSVVPGSAVAGSVVASNAASEGDGVGDQLACGFEEGMPAASAPLLVTACAASASPQDAARRLQVFPAAVAEDMEGFGVAAACRLAGVPLEIVRGISNVAGDRDKTRWQVAAALRAAATLARRLLEDDA